MVEIKTFKLPYQSKFGYKRVQKPRNGTFKDHFIGRYGDDHFIGHLEVEEGNVKPSFDVIKGDGTSPSSPSSNNIIKNLNERKYTNTSTELYDIGPINNNRGLGCGCHRFKKSYECTWIGNWI